VADRQGAGNSIPFFLGVIAIVVVVFAMREAQALVVPLLLALFAALIASPGVAWLEKKGLPTPLAVVGVVVAMVAIGLAMGALVGTSLRGFSDKLPVYREQLTQRVRDAQALLPEGIEAQLDGILDTIDPGKAMSLAVDLLNGVSGALTNLAMILFVMILMLFELSNLPARIEAALPDSKGLLDYYSSVSDSLKRYMVIKTIISAITGGLAALLATIVGLDFAILWGLLAFLLNYIPTIGSILAAIPAVLMALIQYGIGEAVIVGAGYIAINVVMGNLVEPRVTGQGLGISTLVVFLSLIFWGWVLGSVGMLLSVPLTMTIKIALEANPDTRWVAVMMGSGPEAPDNDKKK
jgi:predicted PurR-regulated permease PerM